MWKEQYDTKKAKKKKKKKKPQKKKKKKAKKKSSKITVTLWRQNNCYIMKKNVDKNL